MTSNSALYFKVASVEGDFTASGNDIVAGTTKIGDPSFRNEERALLSEEKINENIGTIKKAFSNYINFDHGDNRAIILDNSEWLDQLNYIEMLRKFGSQFTIGRMLTFESVKERLKREQSLSFLEFLCAHKQSAA